MTRLRAVEEMALRGKTHLYIIFKIIEEGYVEPQRLIQEYAEIKARAEGRSPTPKDYTAAKATIYRSLKQLKQWGIVQVRLHYGRRVVALRGELKGAILEYARRMGP